MRSKSSLGSSREAAQGCGVSFVNCFYLVPLIISQNFYATRATENQTGSRRLPPQQDPTIEICKGPTLRYKKGKPST